MFYFALLCFVLICSVLLCFASFCFWATRAGALLTVHFVSCGPNMLCMFNCVGSRPGCLNMRYTNTHVLYMDLHIYVCVCRFGLVDNTYLQITHVRFGSHCLSAASDGLIHCEIFIRSLSDLGAYKKRNRH